MAELFDSQVEKKFGMDYNYDCFTKKRLRIHPKIIEYS